MTDEIEAAALALIQAVEDKGGAVAAIEQGFQKSEIERSAYRVQLEIDNGERTVVGVNRFVLDQEDHYEPLRVDPTIEADQRARLEALRADRDNDAVEGGARPPPGRGPRHRQPALPDEGGARGARHRRRGRARAARGLGRLPAPRDLLSHERRMPSAPARRTATSRDRYGLRALAARLGRRPEVSWRSVGARRRVSRSGAPARTSGSNITCSQVNRSTSQSRGHEPVVAAAVAVEGRRAPCGTRGCRPRARCRSASSARSTRAKKPSSRITCLRLDARVPAPAGAWRAARLERVARGVAMRRRTRATRSRCRDRAASALRASTADGRRPGAPRGVGHGQGLVERQVEAAVDDGAHRARHPPVDDLVGVEVAPVAHAPRSRRSAGCACARTVTWARSGCVLDLPAPVQRGGGV